MQIALFLFKPCRRMRGGGTQLHEFLTYTLGGDKWSAAHVSRFALVEMTACRVCPRASLGALEKKRRLRRQKCNR
jgi:hypothetical protein